MFAMAVQQRERNNGHVHYMSQVGKHSQLGHFGFSFLYSISQPHFRFVNRQCRPFVESLEPESGLILELCKFLSLSKNSSQTQS